MDDGGGPGVPRPAHRWRLVARGAVVVVCAVLLAVAAIWGADLAFAPTPVRLEVTSVRLTTQPAPARVECPRAAVGLRAVFTTNGVAGGFTIRWSGPGGKPRAERELTATAGQRRVVARLRLTFRGPRSLRGPATVGLVDGELTASRFVVYRCPS